MNDPIGRAGVPSHYAGDDGVETIDKIRAALGDVGFKAYCVGNVMKYRARAGKKGSEDEDLAKADWYMGMVDHLDGNGPDPRSARPGWVGGS